MTISTYIAAAVVAVIVGWCLKALVRAIKRDIDRVDDWWQPSEAGKLAKERFDANKANAEQKQILRTINKPKYQQPRSES